VNAAPTQAVARRSLYTRPLFVCGLLALITLALYWRVSSYPFIVFDDQEYITLNPRVQGGLTPSGILWALTSFYASNWHPLTWMSHMLDVSLFSLSPGGPHIVNVLLHTANACLVFYLCLRLFARKFNPVALSTGSEGDDPPVSVVLPAFFVAALFAWHPTRVESVAWISERKDVLSTCFTLLTILSYLKACGGQSAPPDKAAAATGSPLPRTRRGYPLKAALLFYILALLAKPMPVTLPVVLLLLDYWPLERFDFSRTGRRKLARLITEKTPFFIAAAACAVLTFLAQHQSGAVRSVSDFSLANRFSAALVAYVAYLGKLVWPSHLAVPYLHPGSFPVSVVVLCVLALVAISFFAFAVARSRGVAVGWLWFLVMLAPVIGLLQVGSQWMADRYTYLPALGLLIAATSAAMSWRPARFPICAAGLIGLAACAWQTNNQLNYWSDSVTLFRHTLAIEPDNYLARNYLGAALAQKGDNDAAIDEYRKALALQPGSAVVLDGLGTALLGRGDNRAAVETFEAAVRANPRSADAQNNLGVALGRLGRNAEAMAAYKRSLQLAPDNAEAHCNIANLLANDHKYDAAIREYFVALDVNPRHLPALNNAAYLLGMSGKMKMSTNLFETALRLAPTNASLRCTYGDVLAAQKLYQSAFRQYELVLKANPNFADAYAGLASLLLAHGQTNEARQFVERAAHLNPNDERIQLLLKQVPVTNGTPLPR
jgi:tetratricopeptide (TPR) repeat protein